MKALVSWGKEVKIHMFVDSDHAGDKLSCKSRSGFLLYINTALVKCFSKKQSTVETSVFGAKFLSMKEGIEALWDLRYLRMVGISISGPSYVYGDNMSVIHDTSHQSWFLERRATWFAIMQYVSLLQWVSPWLDIVADLLTKVLHGHKRRYLVSNILYDKHNH